MTIQEVILRMYPYWILGFLMLYAVWNSKHRDLLAVNKKSLMKWALMLGGLTIYRVLVFKFLVPQETLHNMTSAALSIPWQMTLTVFWEDAVHGLPLVILGRMMNSKKWYYKPVQLLALLLTMISFGLGHVYQGAFAAVILSFYIPFSMSIGKKHGFGTVMLGHMMYDLATILTIRSFIGQ